MGNVDNGIFVHAIVTRHVETVCALSKLFEVKHHIGVQAERQSGTTQGGLSRD